jgi:long-chain acyl-CoA synthetase
VANDTGAAIGAMMAPGAKYEVGAKTVNGIDYRVFLNIPQNMLGLYQEGLEFSDQTFLVYENDRWTYRECYLRAAKIAQCLANDFDIKKGDRVALTSRNYPEWITTYMAVTMMGAVIVPMNSWWLGNELEFGLQDSGAKVLFGDKQRIESVSNKLAQLSIKAVAIRCPELVNESIPDINDLMIGWQEASAPVADVAPEDWATMLYTSGSTGKPKGVISTHRNILSQVYSVSFGVKALAILAGADQSPKASKKEQSAMLLPLPLFHVTGCNVQFLPSFLVGRKLVMMYKWDAGKALELIEKEKITSMTGVPTMGQDLIEHPDFSKRDISSLKEVSSGGAAKPPEQVRSMAKKAPNLRAGVGYGLTEVSGAVASMGGADYLKYPSACGKAIPPLTDIKVFLENGEEAALEEWGEVCIKGPMVMKGYWNRPEATAEALTLDGWFKTGDIGYLNAEGFLFLVDRAKDIVIRGGENIGCAEVEGAIALHDAVMEVAVYSLPDERLGEIVGATLMLKANTILTDQELKNFLKDKISAFKIPEHIHFQYEALPRGATEKIYKLGIREAATKILMEKLA